ncbi:Secreted effector protein PipB2 [Pontiella desulfatans]|uniref:Secreted effector protein PipB2 n=2 Tax=Pontiella desulfatans TaxID=2750659 RepID=A0A6C2TYA7_PONDE|nr:Secreted effector protein PipB2 [Pontiella desulfatans]
MEKYALVVGIDLYKEEDAIQKLDYAYEDATRMHDFLLLSGYKSTPLYGPHADCNTVVRKLESISKKLQEGDTFLFYFSGHGFQAESAQYVLPYDAQTWAISKKGGNAVSMEFIEEATRVDGVERILIVDACRKPLERGKDLQGTTGGISSRAIRGALQYAPPTSPVSIFCSCSPGQRSYEFKKLGGGVFTEALLHVFDQCMAEKSEISLPGIASHVQDKVSELLANHSSQQLVQQPFVVGGKTVILSGSPSVIANSRLTEVQQKAKGEADELLKSLLVDHSLWLDAQITDSEGQLTWGRLERVFSIYAEAGLGELDLAGTNMQSADFSEVKFPKGISLARALLNSSAFTSSSLIEVDFTGCDMSDCNFCDAKVRCCDFSDTMLEDADFSDAELIDCKFDDSLANDTDFRDTKLKGSSFVNTSLVTSNFSDSSAINTDFTEADLTASTLIQADFSGATLTGVHLYGTARSDWVIDRVKCRYVYWDKYGRERFPPENDYQENEFIDQHRDYTEFSYTFTDGLTPMDLLLATHIVDEINKNADGFEIKIDNASVRGLNPTINFIMVSGADKKAEALEKFKNEYEHTITLLEQALANKEALLAEQGQRAGLAENQLAVMNALVQRMPESPSGGMNIRQQLSFYLFEPLLTLVGMGQQKPAQKTGDSVGEG